MGKYEHVFTPIKISRFTVDNRIGRVPGTVTGDSTLAASRMAQTFGYVVELLTDRLTKALNGPTEASRRYGAPMEAV